MGANTVRNGSRENGGGSAALWRWLYLSDVHIGCRGEAYRRQAMEAFRTDVTDRARQRGGPDLILLTGDLANCGTAEEFQRFDAFLADLLGWLAEAAGGPAPLVIPVPGNHDLVRPRGREAREYSILDKFGQGLEDTHIKGL